MKKMDQDSIYIKNNKQLNGERDINALQPDKIRHLY